jgi:LuxR family maltose regulon positive regulatory protein
MRRVNSSKGESALNAENKRRDGELYYFPERIMSRLAKIPDYPVTFLEAPSGFGKTTAVRKYLKDLGKNLPEGVKSFWHICLGESPAKTWSGICELFSNVDRKMAENLRELGVPTMETLSDIAEIARSYQTSSETFIVVDNYQLFDCGIHREIAEAFSTNGDRSLHVIFITQPIDSPTRNVRSGFDIHNIVSGDLLFAKEDISRYSRMMRVALSDEERDRLFLLTEGWIAVVSLQLMNFREHGAFVYGHDCDALVEKALWNRLSVDERYFLLSVSPLDSFSPSQAAIMHGMGSLPENILRLLKRSAFIAYSQENGMYYMHSILRDYLLKNFEYEGLAFRSETIRRAAGVCANAGNYLPAVKFYLKVKDYEAIMSMKIEREQLYNDRENYAVEIIAEIARNCPADILVKYPLTLLEYAFHLFLAAKFDVYMTLRRHIDRSLDSPNIPQNDAKRIRGELAMLDSFHAFNDIRKMSERHRAALGFFGGESSSFFTPRTRWTFGTPSILFMFWSEPGELDEELAAMDECIPIYMEAVGGRRSGAAALMRAEAALCRGNEATAESAYYETQYLADSNTESEVRLCAELARARLALLRGDAPEWSAARGEIEKHQAPRCNRILRRMSDMARAFLSFVLEETADAAGWLHSSESIIRTMFAQAVPYGEMLYGKLLLLEGCRAELEGMLAPALERAKSARFILPQVYCLIYGAIVSHNAGNAEEAERRLREALELTRPDKIYLPFAEHWRYLEPVFSRIYPPREDIRAIRALSERFSKGVQAIKASINKSSRLVLSQREREVAALAAKGLTNPEIAARLFITRGTVKNTIAHALEKTGTKSRSELTAWMMKN